MRREDKPRDNQLFIFSTTGTEQEKTEIRGEERNGNGKNKCTNTEEKERGGW